VAAVAEPPAKAAAAVQTHSINGDESSAVSSSPPPAPSPSLPTRQVAASSFGGRRRLASILLSPDGGEKEIGSTVAVAGWSRTIREAGGGKFAFVELNDGSTLKGLQVVVDGSVDGFDRLVKCGTGSALRFEGELVASKGREQKVELQATSITIYSSTEGKDYPLAKKRHSREYLRTISHLRPRTNLMGAVTRVRSAMAEATHNFFQSRGFLYIHTPIITCSDCEGAGEMFQVTTLLPGDLSRDRSLPLTKNGSVDYSKDFFQKAAYLTVSGQLAVENYCCAVGDCYTFGPTFRAENSNTARHLAEFWMIEPEMAFAELSDTMTCAEEYLAYCVRWALEHCGNDLEFFNQWVDKSLLERLEQLVEGGYRRVSYTEAIDLLQKEVSSGSVSFDVSPDWGIDLGTEHERHLTEKVFGKPVTVYNYPKEIKAFYMRLNDDDRTVAAMDVLLPKIGEVIGGSQREERLDVLDRRLEECGLDKDTYWWYRDLRRYGSIPHSGFGLGFERLLMLVTGVDNIRDVIPFPRHPGHAEM